PNCNPWGTQGEGKRTARVGSFAANAFGLHDTAMSGNGWRTAGTIAMREIHPPTARRGQQEATATSGSFAAGPGSTIQTSSARPSATGAPPSPGATPWASGSAGRLPLESLPLYLWGPGGEAPWTLPRRAA